MLDELPDVEAFALGIGNDSDVDLLGGAGAIASSLCFGVETVCSLGWLRQEENGVSVVGSSSLRVGRDVGGVVVQVKNFLAVESRERDVGSRNIVSS